MQYYTDGSIFPRSSSLSCQRVYKRILALTQGNEWEEGRKKGGEKKYIYIYIPIEWIFFLYLTHYRPLKHFQAKCTSIALGFRAVVIVIYKQVRRTYSLV